MALMSITARALTPEDWEIFRQIRLRALRAHPGVYLGSYKDTAARTERQWKEMLGGYGKCIFGLFDCDRMIGLEAIFTSRDDPSGQSDWRQSSDIPRALHFLLQGSNVGNSWPVAQ